jgi:hypothetical protein
MLLEETACIDHLAEGRIEAPARGPPHESR